MLKRAGDRAFEAECEACGTVLSIEGAFSSTAQLRLMREGWHLEPDSSTWCGECQPTQVRAEPRARKPGDSDV